MSSVLRRVLFFFQRNQFDRDLEDELRFHEEMKAHALADAEGLSGDEARAAARRRIGNPLRLREQSREPWTFATVETFAQDVRHALRLIRRDPAFACQNPFAIRGAGNKSDQQRERKHNRRLDG